MGSHGTAVRRLTKLTHNSNHWYSFSTALGVFSRLLPLAAETNARIVLVNRRDYPDSAPYTEEELRLLLSAQGSAPEAAADLKEYMKARARELYNFLVEFVRDEHIPVDSIVLAGWSFGSAWMLALLAHAPTFPVNDLELDKCIRRAILYGLFALYHVTLISSVQGLSQTFLFDRPAI